MYKSLYTIVLNYNKYADTRQCIESLQRSVYPIKKIVLVDNSSQDGSIEQLQKDYSQNDNVYIITNKRNIGFASGVNVGIQYSLALGADLIFLLNNDAIIDQACIEKLCSVMEETDRIGIVGPRIFYYKDPERIWQGGGHFNCVKSGIVSPEKNKLEIYCSEKPKEVTFLTGCAMLITSQVFKKIGLFDNNFFFYGEDVDFCLRASRAGFKLLYIPSAKVWHKIEDIAKDRTSPFVLYHMARSQILVLRKNFSTPYFLYGLLVHLVGYTPYRILQVMKGSRSLPAITAWIRGTWAGIVGIQRGSPWKKC